MKFKRLSAAILAGVMCFGVFPQLHLRMLMKMQ